MTVILNLGNTENTKLVRDIREMGVYSKIYPHDITASKLKGLPSVKGIVINGGPNNIVDGSPIDVCPELYEAGYLVMAAGHSTTAYEHSIHNWDEADSGQVLRSFVFDTCKVQPNWNVKNFISDQVELIRQQMGDKKVLLALSGGVDNSVVVALLIKAIGRQLTCIHVNHDLMRKGESESIIDVSKNQVDVNLVYMDTTDRFLRKLAGATGPEQKRKIIGTRFIRVFEEGTRKLEGVEFLAQGTIYPDAVESRAETAKVVKSHHSVGGLPEDLNFTLVEPLRQLFRDEMRACGLELGLPHSMVYRQPFPGPGLGVRCLETITRERLGTVRESDAILREEFANVGLDRTVRQYFTIAPDFKLVGVRDSACCFDNPVIIRAVNTVDAMTAPIKRIDYDVLQRITDRILKEVKSVNRVCYDLSPRPTATIEWEQQVDPPVFLHPQGQIISVPVVVATRNVRVFVQGCFQDLIIPALVSADCYGIALPAEFHFAYVMDHFPQQAIHNPVPLPLRPRLVFHAAFQIAQYVGQASLVAAAVPVKGFLMVVDRGSLIVLYRYSCHAPMPFDFTGIVQGRAIRRRADKYIDTLPIYTGIGTVYIHDRIRVYLRNSRLPSRFTFFYGLFTKPADHSSGDIQLPTGQIFKEIPTLIDGNTTTVIQQKEKGLDRRTIVDFIRSTGWEFCMARLSGLRVAVYLRFMFGDT